MDWPEYPSLAPRRCSSLSTTRAGCGTVESGFCRITGCIGLPKGNLICPPLQREKRWCEMRGWHPLPCPPPEGGRGECGGWGWGWFHQGWTGFRAGCGLMEPVQGPRGLDGDTPLAATRDVRGQRLTSGGCRDECAEHFMVQATPATFHAARSQERPPGGRSGAARRASRWVPGEGGAFAGLVPASHVPH